MLVGDWKGGVVGLRWGFEGSERGEGDVQILFWNVASRILRGEKRVGGFGSRAEPAGGS